MHWSLVYTTLTYFITEDSGITAIIIDCSEKKKPWVTFITNISCIESGGIKKITIIISYYDAILLTVLAFSR